MDNTINNRPKERKGGKRKTAAVDPVDMETTEPQPPPAATPAPIPQADNDAQLVADFASQNGINIQDQGVLKSIKKIVVALARFFRNAYVNHRDKIETGLWVSKEFTKLLFRLTRTILGTKIGQYSVLALGLGLGLKALYDYIHGKYITPFFHLVDSYLAGYNYETKAVISLHYQISQCVVNLSDAIYKSVEKHGTGSMGMMFLDLLTPKAKSDVINLFKNRRFNFTKEKKNQTLLLDFEKNTTQQNNSASLENITNQSHAITSEQMKEFATKLSQQICSTNPLLLTPTNGLPLAADPAHDPAMFTVGQKFREAQDLSTFALKSVLTTSVLAGIGYVAYRVHRIYTTHKEEKRKDEAYEETVQRCRPKARTYEQFEADLQAKPIVLSQELLQKIASGEINHMKAMKIQCRIIEKTETAKWENEVKEEQEYNKDNPQ